jgi:hypothetical protein
MPFQYIAAIWEDWLARMSGLASLIFTLLGVYSEYFAGIRGNDRAKLFCWIAAVACFLFANYRIWADERKKCVSQRPKFDMHIEGMHYEYSAQHDNTVIILAVYLLNQGAPSVARAWRGHYEVGESCEEMRLIHINQWTIRSANELVNLTAADQIAAKTIERRVETGEAKTGRIFFTLPGNRIDQIRGLHFKLRVICHDFLGAPCTALFSPAAEPVFGVPIYPNEMGQVLALEPTEGLLGFPPPPGAE